MKRILLISFVLLSTSALGVSVQQFIGSYSANTVSNYTFTIILHSDMSARIESVIYPIECDDCKKKVSSTIGEWRLQSRRIIITLNEGDDYVFNITNERGLSLEKANLSPNDKMFSFEFKKK